MNTANQMTTTGQLGVYESYRFPSQDTVNLHYWRRPDCRRVPLCMHCWHPVEGLGATASGVDECCKCLVRTTPATLTWTNGNTLTTVN